MVAGVGSGGSGVRQAALCACMHVYACMYVGSWVRGELRCELVGLEGDWNVDGWIQSMYACMHASAKLHVCKRCGYGVWVVVEWYTWE